MLSFLLHIWTKVWWVFSLATSRDTRRKLIDTTRWLTLPGDSYRRQNNQHVDCGPLNERRRLTLAGNWLTPTGVMYWHYQMTDLHYRVTDWHDSRWLIDTARWLINTFRWLAILGDWHYWVTDYTRWLTLPGDWHHWVTDNTITRWLTLLGDWLTPLGDWQHQETDNNMGWLTLLGDSLTLLDDSVPLPDDWLTLVGDCRNWAKKGSSTEVVLLDC